MAGEDGKAFDDLSWLALLESDPAAFDFHMALRRIENRHRGAPRLGSSLRPAEEPMRLGQQPSTSFAPSAIAGYRPSQDGKAPRLDVAFTGMFGPHGPLPLHLTEYARERMRNAGDTSFTSFVNLLQHRMLLLFHKAWVTAQATASRDRPELDRFRAYAGSLLGAALVRDARRGGLFDEERIYYAGHLAMRVRNPEAVESIVSDYFDLPARVEEFIGEWVKLPDASRWRLGHGRQVSTLGESTIIGARTWRRDHKFRVVLGPLSRPQLEDMLPGADGMKRLRSVVRACVGDELDWDVRLVRAPDATDEIRLRQCGRLAWTTRLGAAAPEKRRTDLVVDPKNGRTVRVWSRSAESRKAK
ncbi:MAG TPA: type VI secretion system baseplate subunit TssG [Polyangiaceae bacterium]